MSTGRGIVFVSRPEIAESLEDTEARYKQWLKDIACLKDVDAYDIGEAGVISILLDFLPDEAHKEITTKHETTGYESSTLKQVMIEVEKIIQIEGDRKASRKDRKSVGGKKIAFAGKGPHHSNDDTQYEYILDTSVNDGHGGSIMTTKCVREDVDEEEDRQTKHRPDAIPEACTETGKSKGKGAKGGKGKGLNPADRKCFLCGEEGHYDAPKDGTSQRVYLAVGGTAYHSCTAKEKARPTGKEESKGKGTKGLVKGKNKGHSFGLYCPQFVDVLEGCNTDAEAAW